MSRVPMNRAAEAAEIQRQALGPDISVWVTASAGSAKIATIHAFCQSLLRRFPLEAGVPPEFAVLEERGAAEALAEAAEAVIAMARDERAPLLADALAVVARYIQEDRFTGLLAAM